MMISLALAPLVLAAAQSPQTALSDRLYAVEWLTGDLYVLGTVDLSMHFVGSTGLANLGALELAPDGFLYGFSLGFFAELYRIDPRTAATTSIQTMGSAFGFVFEGGIAILPNGTAYATNQGNAVSAHLFLLDLSGSSPPQLIGEMGSADINGLALRSDGQLVGLDRVSQSLVTIDPSTAAMTHLARFAAAIGGIGGMTIVDGTGYLVTGGPLSSGRGSHELYTFDPFTGSTTLVMPLPEVTPLGFAGLSATRLGGTRGLLRSVAASQRAWLTGPVRPWARLGFFSAGGQRGGALILPGPVQAALETGVLPEASALPVPPTSRGVPARKTR